MTNIYVLDIETTGLQGALFGDKVLEVGVARVNLDTGNVYPEYSRIVFSHLTKEDLNCWAFQNTTLTPEDVAHGDYAASRIARQMGDLYDYKPFTSYNRAFDFDKFMNIPPWSSEWTPGFAPCLKEVYAEYFTDDGRWVSAQVAYNELCPDNPAGLEGGRELHRALDDAMMEGWILIRMCEKNPALRAVYDRCWEDYTGVPNEEYRRGTL